MYITKYFYVWIWIDKNVNIVFDTYSPHPATTSDNSGLHGRPIPQIRILSDEQVFRVTKDTMQQVFNKKRVHKKHPH